MKNNSNKEAQLVNIRKIGCFIVILAMLTWFLLYLISPPMFSGTDVFDYKDAGINLALGRGLVTRTSPSNPTLDYTFYGNYPPLLPVLYSLLVRMVGISPKVNRLFDLLLASMAGLAFWLALQPRFCPRSQLLPNILIFSLILLTLPFGPFWADLERPDTLGFILTLISLSTVMPRFSPPRAFGAGFIWGINALVSPFTGLMNGVLLSSLCIIRKFVTDDKDNSQLSYNHIIYLTAGLSIPLLTAFLIIWFNDPEAILRIMNHALGASTGGHSGLGYLLRGNYLNAFKTIRILMHKVKLAFLLLVAILVIAYLVKSKFFPPRTNKIYICTCLMIFGMPLLLFPYQTNYMSLAGALILVLFARLTEPCSVSGDSRPRWVIFLALSFIAIFEIVFIVRGFVTAYASAPSLPRMQKVLTEVKNGNPKKPLLVATPPEQYFLFKGKGFDVVNLRYIGPRHLDGVDLIALSFTGSGNPEKPLCPGWWNPGRVELLYRPNLPQQTELFGQAISKSSNIWEVELYKLK